VTAVRVVEPPSLPEIQIGTDVARMADEGIKALAADTSVYQRSGMLVRVVRSSEPPRYDEGKFRRPAGIPTIVPIAHATLVERMSACARWIKQGSKSWVQVLPNEPAVRAAGARREWGGIRPLLAVTSAPTMRPDGTILQTPGFDASTGLLYWPNGSYHAVPENPTRDDAVSAWDSLCESVCDFPFARDEHRAAWVAAVLTLLLRVAISGPVPLFAIDATTRGTGKSMLADAAFRIAFGHGAARTSLPDEEEEFRKRITALAVEGDPAVLIDNIAHGRTLGGSAFEAALTSEVWKDRVLGVTGMVKVPMLIVWFATGNNMGFSSDVARRTLHMRLESELENPEEREGFKHANLMQWIDGKRHHLVTWALTMVRAWVVAGRPKMCKTWGTFEAWSELVPNVIKWVSGLDPMVVRASADDVNDGDKLAIRALVECIGYLAQDKPITAKQLVVALYGSGGRDGETPQDHHASYQGAREAIETGTYTKVGQIPATTKVGILLRKHLGRVVGEKKIVLGPVQANMQTWAVRSVLRAE
jgi:hypothetical protein